MSDDLRVRYIEALIDRLRMWPVDKDSGALCERIERNLAELPGTAAIVAWGPFEAPTLVEMTDPTPEVLSEPAPNIPVAFPLPPVEAVASGPSVEDVALGQLDANGHATEPLTVERLQAMGHAPTSPTGKPMVACEDCGGQFAKGPGITLHRRSHAKPGMMRDSYAAAALRAQVTEAEAVRQVAEHAREHPVDVVAAREADDGKHHERARAKAAETWERRHGGEALR